MSSDTITIAITIKPGENFGQSYFYPASITFDGHRYKQTRHGEVHLMWSPHGGWDRWGRREWVEDELMRDIEDFEWAAVLVLDQLTDRTPRTVTLTWTRPVWDQEADLHARMVQ